MKNNIIYNEDCLITLDKLDEKSIDVIFHFLQIKEGYLVYLKMFLFLQEKVKSIPLIPTGKLNLFQRKQDKSIMK